MCRYLNYHLLEKHSSLDNWYHAWLAVTQLLQMHGYILELNNKDIFRYFGRGGGGLLLGHLNHRPGYACLRALFLDLKTAC